MFHRKLTWLIAAFLVFLLISGGAVVYWSKPRAIDLSAPTVTEYKSAISRMYQLQTELVCKPGTNVDVLDEILLDTSDYHPNLRDLNTIGKVYGIETAVNAGYLTSQKAYYLSRRSPSLTTPEPGIMPTAAPIVYCPDPSTPVHIDFQKVVSGKGDRAAVQYDYGGGVFEAILRPVNGKWMITSVRLVRWHGV